MRTPQALCNFVSLKRLSLAVVAAAGALVGPVAHSSPLSAYIGATAGLAPNGQNCDGQQGCDRVSGGAKAFVGWNITPNVSAEANYFYFGSTTSESETPNLTYQKTGTRAFTLNMSWNIEMFEKFTSHLRLGVARVSNRREITNYVQTTRNGVVLNRVGSVVENDDSQQNAYFGLGMSFPFNPNFRLTIGYDFIPVRGEGNRDRHLLAGGIQAEF